MTSTRRNLRKIQREIMNDHPIVDLKIKGP